MSTRVTCEDLDTGETDSVVIEDDYCLVTDGRVELAHQTMFVNGTTTLTLKRRDSQSGDPESGEAQR